MTDRPGADLPRPMPWCSTHNRHPSICGPECHGRVAGREQEHTQVFVVRIPTYGDPERERDRLAVSLGRALHQMVKPGCTLAPFDLEYGRLSDWVAFDSQGFDGHHDGHDAPLIPAPDGT